MLLSRMPGDWKNPCARRVLVTYCRRPQAWLTWFRGSSFTVYGQVLKRIGWIVFVLLLTAFILAGAYRAMRHQEARPPTPHTPSPYR